MAQAIEQLLLSSSHQLHCQTFGVDEDSRTTWKAYYPVEILVSVYLSSLLTTICCFNSKLNTICRQPDCACRGIHVRFRLNVDIKAITCQSAVAAVTIDQSLHFETTLVHHLRIYWLWAFQKLAASSDTVAWSSNLQVWKGRNWLSREPCTFRRELRRFMLWKR